MGEQHVLCHLLSSIIEQSNHRYFGEQDDRQENLRFRGQLSTTHFLLFPAMKREQTAESDDGSDLVGRYTRHMMAAVF